MDIQMLWKVLMWCSIINIAFLWMWGLMIWLAHDWVYRLHSKFFKLSVETFDGIHYGGIAFYKILFFIFNIVPFIALSIVK